MGKQKKSFFKKTKKFMSKNTLLLAALGGVAIAALVTNYLRTENGKQMLRSTSGTLKDLTGKATAFAKDNYAKIKGGKELQPA